MCSLGVSSVKGTDKRGQDNQLVVAMWTAVPSKGMSERRWGLAALAEMDRRGAIYDWCFEGWTKPPEGGEGGGLLEVGRVGRQLAVMIREESRLVLLP